MFLELVCISFTGSSPILQVLWVLVAHGLHISGFLYKIVLLKRYNWCTLVSHRNYSVPVTECLAVSLRMTLKGGNPAHVFVLLHPLTGPAPLTAFSFGCSFRVLECVLCSAFGYLCVSWTYWITTKAIFNSVLQSYYCYLVTIFCSPNSYIEVLTPKVMNSMKR